MKVLMVSGEYPPMKGGVGRYTSHLVAALNKRRNISVHIAVGTNKQEYLCSATTIASADMSGQYWKDDNNFSGPAIRESNSHVNIITKGDRKNSDRLLALIREIKPDVVNIQYERGLYEIDSSIIQYAQCEINGSTLRKFYNECPVPIVSTLHTVFPHNEYLAYITERALRKEGRLSSLPPQLRLMIRRWVLKRRYELLFDVVKISDAIIALSKAVQEIVKSGSVIYHGAEPALSSLDHKNQPEFRKEFGLPDDKRLLLAFGYVGSYKGFDMLDSLRLPKNWKIVVKQNIHDRGTEQPVSLKKNLLCMNLDYLDDEKLSKLFYACDAIIMPYRVVSVSGVLFDALAHGLPFIASDLGFFREFSAMGLGITCDRSTASLSQSISSLEIDYERYKGNVERFKPRLRWSSIAEGHVDLYSRLMYESNSSSA